MRGLGHEREMFGALFFVESTVNSPCVLDGELVKGNIYLYDVG